MSNALSVISGRSQALAEAGLTGSTTFTSKEAEETTGIKANRYFPFVQLVQKMSQANSGPSKAGEFLLKKNGKDKEPVNLGNSFEAIVCSTRGKATYYDGKIVKAEYHTAQMAPTEKYLEFRDAALKDSTLNSPFRAGLDVLLWIPALGCFATYYANTKTTVSSVEQTITPFADCAVRMFSDEKTGSKGSWFVPSASELAPEQVEAWENQMPNDLYIDAMKTFLKPVPTVEEAVEGAEKAGAATRSR